MSQEAPKHDRRPFFSRLWLALTSAFALTLLTAMLFLQGKAYREGWLGYFGLERSQFPISTTDAYWLTLYGWSHTATQWFSGAWADYPKQLWKYGWLLFLLTLGAMQFERYRIQRAARVNAEPERDNAESETANTPKGGWLATVTGWKRWASHALVAALITPFSLAALPSTLFVTGLLLALIIAVAIGPFQKIGRQAAIEFCSRPTNRGAKIILNETSSFPDWGYRIECNPDLCAFVRDGRVFVVRADQIQRIELPALQVTEAATVAPPGQHLCPVPSAVSDSRTR